MIDKILDSKFWRTVFFVVPIYLVSVLMFSVFANIRLTQIQIQSNQNSYILAVKAKGFYPMFFGQCHSNDGLYRVSCASLFNDNELKFWRERLGSK